MAQRKLTVPYGSPNPNREVLLSGSFTIGASGAISSQTAVLNSGVTITQDVTGSAVGRYLAVFDRTTYKALKYKGLSMTGPAAGTAFPTTTGIDPTFRLYTATLPANQAASIQLTRSDTKADADAASGTVVYYFFIVEG